jgi:hypothetical protein
MIENRQAFEIGMLGAVPEAVRFPMFEFKRMLGDELTEYEQGILDAGRPKGIDAKSGFTMINTLHHGRDHMLPCFCNERR